MGDLHVGGVPVYCRSVQAGRRGVWPLALALQLLATAAWGLSLPAGIIGGTGAANGAWPWQVSIGWGGMTPYAGHFCGGALVNIRWVVTAAHCVIDSSSGAPVDPSRLQLTLGTNDLQSGGMTAGTNRVVIHPNFDFASFDNDIALLELDQDATCSGCNSIPLVSPDTEPAVAGSGTQATVTGWGVTSINAMSIPSTLQEVQVPIVDNATCSADYGGSAISPRMICAGTGGKDSCQGDSGGPLVVRNNQGTGYLLAGLVSFGNGCADAAFPGVYTRASSFSAWVGGTASERSGGGGGGGETGSLLPLLAALGVARLRRARAAPTNEGA